MARRMKQAQDFTLSMAAVDCIPVVLFACSAFVLSMRFDSIFFRIGALLVILAGAMKAGWKFVLALARKDVPFLSRQMRYLMPFGFGWMVAGLLINRDLWSFFNVLKHIVSFPAVVFFIVALAAMGMMFYAGKHFAQKDAGANWMEQGINIVMQGCILLGILL